MLAQLAVRDAGPEARSCARARLQTSHSGRAPPMQIAAHPKRSSSVPLGLGLLVLGILIGALARPGAWIASLSDSDDRLAGDAAEDPSARAELGDEVELQRPMAPGADPAPRRGLEVLYVDLDPEASAVIQRVRDRSMEGRMIVQEEGDLVPATVRLGDKTVQAEVRIKGDYVDHINTDKWSLRIELKDDKLLGMSRFSIQHPKTRGFLWEWLIMNVSRRDGLLAPRATFVDVVMNGNDLGIYYLEEHFTKELIESMGRREGPIVRFDESLAMGMEDQFQHLMHTMPPTVRRTTFLTTAEVTAFGEKRLAQADGLSRQLQEALAQMEVIQRRVLLEEEHIGAPGLALIQAQVDQAARTIDDVLDVDLTARMHALMCLFRCSHGLAWKNRRFYHNPITARLEPVVFDTLAGKPIGERDPVAMYTHTNRAFLTSASYNNHLFRHLAELAHPNYLAELFAEFEPDLERFSRLMAEEGLDDPQADVARVKHLLYDQQIYLRELLRPRDAVNFDCYHLGEGDNRGDIVVEAWATTRVPVVFQGFRFSNGSFLDARRALRAEPGAPSGAAEASDAPGEALPGGLSWLKDEPQSVVLPHDGRRVRFRFATDQRLATLRDVQKIKNVIRTESEEDKSFKLRLTAEYRAITESSPREELLWIRRFGRGWEAEGGRPRPPHLQEALDAHGFLSFDPEAEVLRVAAGEWDVEGDLVVPDGYPLHAGPGVRLRFAPGAALISGEALVFEVSEAELVVLGPWGEDWSGVCVLQAPGKSVWRHVRVSDTVIIERGGWMMTGGVTFYRSPVDLVDCRFENALGEDALNVFGTELAMERVVLDTVASDAFDGDFVTGTIRDCTVANSVEDGIDVSGSDVDVVGCRFVDIGDKAISAGENSVVRARDCVVESASIGVASKDFSRVDLRGVEVRKARYYGLAVYVKKPEFGPSSIIGQDLVLGEVGLGPHIVQEGCELVLDGETFPGEPLDVKELYRQKILGQ